MPALLDVANLADRSIAITTILLQDSYPELYDSIAIANMQIYFSLQTIILSRSQNLSLDLVLKKQSRQCSLVDLLVHFIGHTKIMSLLYGAH